MYQINDIINKILCGDSLIELKKIPDESIDMVCTSPPYWNLRDYGTAKWEGGREDCDHKSAKEKSRYDYAMQAGSRHAEIAQTTKGTDAPKWKDICPTCGAKKIDNQIGLEKTPDEYVAKLVAIFREVRRVLKKDGILWLVLGDSYNGSGKAGSNPEYQARHTEFGKPSIHQSRFGMPTDVEGLKPKDLVGIPWRVAFALQGFAVVPFRSFTQWADILQQAREKQDWILVEFVEGLLRKQDLLTALNVDGWYLRQDLIWHKPNPMPESVTDRCTKSHEYIFLLTKSAQYYYDNEAIKETATGYDGRKDTFLKGSQKYANGFVPSQPAQTMAVRGHERWQKRKNDGTDYGGNGTGFQDHSGYSNLDNPYVRNKRSVFIANEEYLTLKKELNFATKQYIIEEMIKRGLL